MVAPLDVTNAEEHGKYEKVECDSSSGPLEKSRTRTDYCWFIAFTFFLVLWSFFIISAFTRGSIKKWLEPTDSAGRVCGRDAKVQNSPYLVQYNRETCSFPKCLVCRKSCPSTNFTYNNNTDETMEEELQHMICKLDVNMTNVMSWDQLNYLVDRQMCAKEYKASNDTNNRCDVDDQKRFHGWRYALPRFNRDIGRAKFSIIGFITLSGLIAVFSIFIMRWHALFFVYGSIFVFYIIMFDYVYEKCVIDAENKTMGALLSLVIFVAALILIFLIGIYFWRKIYLACQMIRESSKAITSMMSAILLPIGVAIVYLVIFTIAVKAHLYLTTLESAIYRVDSVDEESCTCPKSLGYVQNANCEPEIFASNCRTPQLKECVLSGCRMLDKQTQTYVVLHFIFFFGIFWIFWFAVGFLDTVLASVFATWYWTFNKKLLSYLTVLESFYRIVTYHLGSIAFGSLIMFVCQVIQFTMNATFQILMKVHKPTAEVTFRNSQCIFDSMDKFFNFINQRAYVSCAVHGSDFVQSGKTSFYLLKRNVEKVVVIFEFTNWIMLFLTVLIACVTTKISASYFISREDLNYSMAVSFVVFVGSMITTWMLLRVVDIAINTIFQCFLEDSERNDGSYQKPYFMHDELTKFLYKK